MEQKNAEISARVGETIEKMGETPNSFAKKLGYNRAQTVYDVLSGKSAPSYDFFRKFELSEFSATISISWLLTGQGSMLKTKGTPSSQDTSLEAIPVTKGTKNNQDYCKKDEKDNHLVNKLLDRIAGQAEEIGRLKSHIEELERRRGEDALNAPASSIAHAG